MAGSSRRGGKRAQKVKLALDAVLSNPTGFMPWSDEAY